MVVFCTIVSKQNLFCAVHRSVPISHAQAINYQVVCLTDVSGTKSSLDSASVYKFYLWVVHSIKVFG